MDIIASLTEPHVVFISAGVVGMIAHWLKKWAKGETSSSLTGYFIKDEINSTFTMLGAFGYAVLGAFATGTITSTSSMYSIVYAGIAAGFAIDSGFNAGAPPNPPDLELPK